jgi:hypothetical protein
VIAFVALNTGWTIDYVGENIDLPRLMLLNKQWRQAPPVRLVLATYAGYKPPEDESKVKAESEAQVQELFTGAPAYKFTPPKVRMMENGN